MWTNPIQKMHAILNKPIVFEKIEDVDLMDVLKVNFLVILAEDLMELMNLFALLFRILSVLLP